MRWPLALVLLAGCAQVEPVADFHPLWSERALDTSDGHDHADPMQHLHSTPNFRVLGHDSLHSDHYGVAPGATFCGDAQEMPDGRRIAAAESRSEVGFTLVDVTNASDPKWLGELVMENTRVYDLAVVPDGRHVVLVTQAAQNLAVPLPPLLHWRTACGSGVLPADPVPRPSSILLVDISNPAAPTIVDHQPLYGYGHSAFATVLDGVPWVLATTTGPATRLSAYETTSSYEFFQVQAGPTGSRLQLVTIYKPAQDLRSTGPPLALGPRGHDAWMAKHPVTGQTLAYLAAWERLEIVDMAEPMRPKVVGTWTDVVAGREGHSGAIHSVLPLPDARDGRHLTLIGPEWHDHPVDHPSGLIWVLDTTDPSKPRAVAGWTLPHEVTWSGEYMFSNHYFSVHGSTLFVSMYHGGVWAVDLAPAFTGGFVNLRSVGVFLPVDPDVNVAVRMRWTPTLEEVLAFDDGTLVTFDPYTGVWAFAFDAGNPAPPPEPWPIHAP